jgi:hypothetical protein
VEAKTDALGLPDDSFNYDDFVKREFGDGEHRRPSGLNWFWWVVAVILIVVFLLVWLGR